MRRFIISAAMAGAAFAGVSASAQTYGQGYDQGYGQGYDQRGNGRYDDRGNGYGYGQQSAQRIAQLRMAVERLARNGRLDRREVSYFRSAVANLAQLDQRYRYNGYTYAERRDIQLRSTNLMRRLRMASQRGGYGYGNDGRDDRWDDRDGRRDDNRRYNDHDRRDDDDDDDWPNRR